MATSAGLILVVEDEPKLREPLAHLLRLRHFEVVTADSSDDALDALQSRRPDAAIIDLQLKRGSGRDVIVKMNPKTPVIIYSGMLSATGELERLRPRTKVVEKPCSLTWLINTLDEMLVRTRELIPA
jgi:DNA-binding response OmpR family regulator